MAWYRDIEGHLIVVTAILFNAAALSVADKDISSLTTGAYLLFIGCVLLISYFDSKRNYVTKMAMWVCLKFSSSSGRGMAIFYAALCWILGSAAAIVSTHNLLS